VKIILTLAFAFLLSKGNGQINIDLSRSHNLVSEKVVYELDFLKLDSIRFFSLNLKDKDVKFIDSKDSVVSIKTRLLYVCNGMPLRKTDRKNIFNKIKTENIVSISLIPPTVAVNRYGRKGRYGAIVLGVH